MSRQRAIVAIVTLLVGAAVVAFVLSALHPPEEVPAYASASASLLSNALVSGEWILTITGAMAALVLLDRRPQRAANMVAASLYTLTVGVALVAYGVNAFGGGDAGMGPAFVGGPLVLLSGIVAAASSVAVFRRREGRRLGRMLIVAGSGAALTVGWLLVRGPTDWQGAVSVTRLHGVPLVLLVTAVCIALLLMNPPPDSTSSRTPT